MDKRYIKDVELAGQSGIPLSTLRADRIRDRRIPFIKIGTSVFYDAATVFDAINQKFSIGSAVKSSGDNPARRIQVRTR